MCTSTRKEDDCIRLTKPTITRILPYNREKQARIDDLATMKQMERTPSFLHKLKVHY